MPFSSIDKGSKYFNTVLYTGDGSSSKAITGVGFKPDLLWIKSRSYAYNHNLFDINRGTKYWLGSNTTSAEDYNTLYPNSFDNDGFTLNSGGSTNASGETYVTWNWLGANTTASNTSGTITSTVSANTTSGFSIVSYTGTGSNATVGHGLGVAPKMVITKVRSASGNNWSVYHSSLGAGNVIWLNLTNASTSDTTFWNNTAPTSSVFSVGTQGDSNRSSNTIIAYCFAEVKGFCKLGSFVGNGSTDGTFVYTGFTPAFVMIKGTQNLASATPDWRIRDNKTNTYNPITTTLYANSSGAEVTEDNHDFLSNGFKVRTSGAENNYSGETYIYMAFASNPFVTSKGIPVTAR